MRWLPLLFLFLLVLLGVAYFFATTHFLNRNLVSSLPTPPPSSFEGPDLVAGYILQRGLRGPESFIEDPNAKTVVPDPSADLHQVGVVRIAIAGPFILGEVADLQTGASTGFFLIDTSSRTVTQSLPEPAWRERVRAATGTGPPELLPADSFSPPEPAP